MPEDLQKLAPEQGLAAVERVLVEEDLENEGHVEEGNAHDGLVRFKDLEIDRSIDLPRSVTRRVRDSVTC